MTKPRGIPQINYIKTWQRLTIAFVLGVLMVYVSEPESWMVLHQYEGYYVAILISTSIAIAISILLHYLNIWLDQKLSWLLRPYARFGLQFAFGLVLPLAITIACLYIYFNRHGYALNETTYFDRVFYPFCLLLLLANGYYPLHYFIQLYQINARQKSAADLLQLQIAADLAKEESAKLRLKKIAQKEFKLTSNAQLKAIALIISFNRMVYYYTEIENKLLWNHTIATSHKLLPKDDFFRVSKSCIVARANIVHAMPYTSKRILLKLAFPLNSYVTVSQRNTTAFTNWYRLALLPYHHMKRTILNE